MSLVDHLQQNQTPAKASFPRTMSPREDVATPKPHTSPESETTGLSLTCKSASPLIPILPLNFSDEKAETPRHKILSSVIDSRSTGMSVFDLKRYCFFHLPQLTGSNRNPLAHNILIHKVNFQHLRSCVTISNVELSTKDNLPFQQPNDAFEKVFFRLGRLNAFSFNAKTRRTSLPRTCVAANNSLGADIDEVQIMPSQARPKAKVSNKAKPLHKKRTTTVCNCKNSKCLKLYCECFKSKGFCSHKCSCVGCGNMSQTPQPPPKNRNRQSQRQKNLSAKTIEPQDASRSKIIAKARCKSGSYNRIRRKERDDRRCVALYRGPVEKRLKLSRHCVSNENLPVLNQKSV